MAKLVGLYCNPHIHGVQVWMGPFFLAGCKTCEGKKRAGKVTGLEPPPPDNREWRRRAFGTGGPRHAKAVRANKIRLAAERARS